MKKTLQIDELNAKRLYKESSAEFKATLEDTFGKGFFFTKIQDRVKTFEDALAIHSEVSDRLQRILTYCPMDEYDDMIPIVANAKLLIIAEALNEGWKPNWNDSNEKKWYPCFDMRSGGSFAATDYVYWDSCSYVGSRLCFKNQELAEYAGKQFESLYKKMMIK